MKLRVQFPNRIVVGTVMGLKEVKTLERIEDMLAAGATFLILRTAQGRNLLVNLAHAETISEIKDDDYEA